MRFASLLLLLFLGAEPQTPSASPLPGQVDLTHKTSTLPPKSLPAAGSPQPVELAALAPSKATAIIVAPREAAPGDLVILDASGSDAASFAWTLAGSSKTFLPVDGGKRCVFSSGSQGKYIFVLATAKSDLVAIATHELTIGKPEPEPTPVPPGPQPTPLPDGKFKLAKLAYDNASKVTSTNRKAEAALMAKAFRSMMAQIAAGTATTPGQILNLTASAIETNLGAAREPWKPWGQSMAVEYQRLYEAKQLPTPADWRTAWDEVAAGLEAVQ